MKIVAIAWLAFAAFGCSRMRSEPHAAPVVDASSPLSASAPDAHVVAPFDAGVDIEEYCALLVERSESRDEFSCRGEKVRGKCDTFLTVPFAKFAGAHLMHVRTADDTEVLLVLAGWNGPFTILERVRTEECDLGDPADVSLKVVSANEDLDGGVPVATIVFDSLRVDPPLQGGPRILTATRRSVDCRAGTGAPACDPPVTLGTFTGPTTDGKAPPFSRWKHPK